MADYGRAYHLASVANLGPFGSTGGGAFLQSISINKVTASAVITVYDGQDNTGTVLAILDGSSTPRTEIFNCWCRNGVFIAQTGAGADVTVVVN